MPINPTQAPRAMAAWVQEQSWGSHPEGAALVQWLLRMESLRYSAAPKADSLGTLRGELRYLQWPRKP
jgi:hypothetical protein